MKRVRNKVSFYSIILYLVAIVLAVYATFVALDAWKYVKEMLDMGQIMVEGNELNIVSYIFSSSGLFYAAAFALVGIGIVLQKVTNVAVPVLRLLAKEEAKSDADYTPEYPYQPEAEYGEGGIYAAEAAQAEEAAAEATEETAE